MAHANKRETLFKNVKMKCAPAIDRGCENGCARHSNRCSARVRTHHFSPSTAVRGSSDGHELKIGAVPTTSLSQFSIEGEFYKEKSSLRMAAGAAESL